ncbi:hypothetical protein GCM10027563_31640 [Parasphingorhabdus pacifica]
MGFGFKSPPPTQNDPQVKLLTWGFVFSLVAVTGCHVTDLLLLTWGFSSLSDTYAGLPTGSVILRGTHLRQSS